ncbi:anthranilate synthase component I family protein [Methanosphaerula palustris]|uniref:anthranilate synthase n=1 Tax=Methanosphaerula palustris (strain ATCC BAA-1556 / DSM 19958 / E1-9c) TaxID=521011 RepID=B8GJ32_METPE|nr:anthranilate synthase component I family protein [Methanosphaerula palustris]ACL15605.1 Anthranilate synthase [Methanosphaerula palustris E1-9c]
MKITNVHQNFEDELKMNLSKEEYTTLARDLAKPLLIPLTCTIPIDDLSPAVGYRALAKGVGALLESVEGPTRLARYSFIAIDPPLKIQFRGNGGVELDGDSRFIAIATAPKGRNPVEQLESVMSRFTYAGIRVPPFAGGMIGSFSYELAPQIHPGLRPSLRQIREEPFLGTFMLVTGGAVFEHLAGTITLFTTPMLGQEQDAGAAYEQAREHLRLLCKTLDQLRKETPRQIFPEERRRNAETYISSLSPAAYQDAVLKAREHIHAGDILQAVISRQITCPYAGDPFLLYRAQRAINPGPYLYYLDFQDHQIAGSSPEMLVRVEGRTVTTVPIAGTRRRGKNEEEDLALATDLLNDPKERAEHLMLVDLARNDIGRVSTYGSVRVRDFMTIERFSHVQHIVSTVQGTLADHLTCFDAFTSCFPAGTVSGAPKVRAMEIINDLEPQDRGLYAGAVGYIGFDRTLDFAIAIRTVVIRDGIAAIQVGAGIVADSVPEHEWKETEAKAAAMMQALDLAGGSV